MTQFYTSNSGDFDIFIRTSQFKPRASSARYVNENKEYFSEHSGKNEYKRRNGFLNEKLKKVDTLQKFIRFYCFSSSSVSI